MRLQKNLLVVGSASRPMGVDIFLPDTAGAKPVLIYAHGFNGFKDWGNFDLIASQFAEAGFVFVKFNFSHNGTTPEQPDEFADLDAYGNNNYSKELQDLECIINWTLSEKNIFSAEVDPNRVFFLGHSLGGGIVILKSAEDKRIKKLVTWASVSECKTPWGSWPAERIDNWRVSGVEYTMNSRTKQQLPLYYQLYEDYTSNINRLNIRSAIRLLKIPVLLCHGTLDEAVPVERARDLQSWQSSAELFTVESDHVFGRRHPWTEKDLPAAMQKVINKTIGFLKYN